MPKFVAQGIFTAMLTPFTRGGAHVDYDAAAGLAENLVARGSSGLFVTGSTGEGQLMSYDERTRVLETVIAAVGNKATIIAHTGHFDTMTALALTEHAAKAGAHAAAAVAPGFYRYDDDALAQHYTALAKVAPELPNLLYNIPQFALNVLSVPLVVRLANEVENIVGIKDSWGDMSYLTHLLNEVPDDFVVINGCDNYGAQALIAGAKAAVSGTANVTVEVYAAIAKHVAAGEYEKAMRCQFELESACRVLKYGSMLSTYKESMRVLGQFDPGFVRPPQRELTANEKRGIEEAWKDLGWLS